MNQPSSWLDRYGNWVSGKYSKWGIVGSWLVLAIILNLLFPTANSQVNNSAMNLDESQPSVQAKQIVEEQFTSDQGFPALIVWQRIAGISDEDLIHIQQIVSEISTNPLPEQKLVPPLHQLPPQALQAQISEDGSTFILPIFFENEVDAEKLGESIQELKEISTEVIGTDPFDLALGADSLVARVSGPVGIAIDAVSLFSTGDFALTATTVLLVLIILLLIYRSPILAFIPLVAVGFAYFIISPVLGIIGEQGWATYDTQGLSIMTVLLFGAGTDYCLFLIARFRQILRTENSTWSAMRKSVSDTSGAIAMSGLTTVLALSTLLVADFGSIQRFAVPFIVSITIVAIASLNLVPAMLAILGRSSFYPFVPRTDEMILARAKRKGKPAVIPPHKPTIGEKLSAVVVHRAKWVTAISLIVLVGVGVLFFQIKYNYDTLSSFPEDMESREGFQMISESFNPGQLAPVKVIVDTQGKDMPLSEKLTAISYVAKVSAPMIGQTNPNLIAYDIEFNVNPYSNEAMDYLPDLRDTVTSVLSTAGVANAADHVWFDGQTSDQFDVRATSTRDAFVIVPLVIFLISLVLLVYLKSVVAMIYLIGTVIVSYFSALGLGWLVIHYILGADTIQGFIPLYSFVFLGALGVDYNIFMISSIWKKARIMPLRQAIKEGASETGAVINSAGIILAGTFAVLATLPIQILVHFGIITAIGILIDTFIVRPFLVPAITTILGKRAFWPGKFDEIPERK